MLFDGIFMAAMKGGRVFDRKVHGFRTDAGSIRLACTFGSTTFQPLSDLAHREHRSVSFMLELLCREALRGRGIEVLDEPVRPKVTPKPRKKRITGESTAEAAKP
jgi:hypothetical protein